MVKKEYLNNIKQLIGSDTKALIDASLSLPKGDKLAELAEDWRTGLDGVMAVLQYSLRKANKGITDDEVKSACESIVPDQIKGLVAFVYGIDEVDDPKKN
jgi:hypothetical protein